MSIERTGAVSGYKSHKEIDFESKQTLSALLADFRVYKSYIQYSDYKYTYLGKFIIQIVNNLSAFKKEAILTDFSAINIELNNCLKTIEDL